VTVTSPPGEITVQDSAVTLGPSAADAAGTAAPTVTVAAAITAMAALRPRRGLFSIIVDLPFTRLLLAARPPMDDAVRDAT